MHCREPHFGFIDHPRNPFSAKSRDLLHAIITHPELHRVFNTVDHNNKIVWLPGPCNQYINKMDNTMGKVFTVIQYTAGAPGRLTEAASRLIRNVPGGSIRNVFVWCCHVLVEMGTFNKTSHATGRDQTMVRATLIRIGRLLIRILVYIRPLLVEWQLYFRGANMAYNAAHYLYMGHYRPTEGSDLSKHFTSLSNRLLRFDLLPSEWRHVASFFMAENAVLFQRAQIQTSAGDIQIGHSGLMGSEYYAQDANVPPDVDKTVFMATIRNSATWHILQEFEEDLWRFIEQGNENRLKKMAIIDSIRRPPLSGLAMPPSRIHRPLPSIPVQPERTDLASLFGENLAKFTGYMMHYMRPDLQMPRSNPHHQPRLLPQPHLLINARKLQNDENFTFRPGQAAASQILYDKVHHLGIFTGTGMPVYLLVVVLISRPDQGVEKLSQSYSWRIHTTLVSPHWSYYP